MARDIGTSELIEVWASGGEVLEPDLSKTALGWQLGEKPFHEFMNFIQNTFGEKLNHILKNGIAQWRSDTPYDIGNTAQNNGQVWLAVNPNTNSEPSGANVNWRRLATVEVIQAVAVAYNNAASGLSAINVQEALDELKVLIDSVSVPSATETVQGIARIAATNEAIAGLNDTRFMTPLKTRQASLAVGVDQSWAIVTRNIGQQYVNNTSKPIMLIGRFNRNAVSRAFADIIINGLQIPLARNTNSSGGNDSCGSIIIPIGATYTLVNPSDAWSNYTIYELRGL